MIVEMNKTNLGSIESYNYRLNSLADYKDKSKLKRLFKNFHNLVGLSRYGDEVAASIVIDLETSLKSNFLTDLQRTCIKCHLIDNSTLREVASDLNRSASTINQAVTGGLKNIQKALKEGE